MKFNVMDLVTSRQHKTIVAIAQRDGFIEKRIVERLYVTSESARNALDFLWGLKILRPTENGNKWIYTKFEKDNTAQKKLETTSQLVEEK